jgi:hypothetical protein
LPRQIRSQYDKQAQNTRRTRARFECSIERTGGIGSGLILVWCKVRLIKNKSYRDFISDKLSFGRANQKCQRIPANENDGNPYEVINGALNVHIAYEFAKVKNVC